MELVEAMLAGDVLSLARLITRVERDSADVPQIMMQQHYLDDGVFIRSMATRGSHGGLPRAAGGVIKLMSAFGKDFVLVESVGVGQTELDIMQNVDTVVG